jgi:hypothetical protein
MNLLIFYFGCKIKCWLREDRSAKNKRIARIIKSHYWPDLATPKLLSLENVTEELRVLRSSSVEDKVASAMTVSAIATSFWSSEKRSDAEYDWVRNRVNDIESSLLRDFIVGFYKCPGFSISDRYFP